MARIEKILAVTRHNTDHELYYFITRAIVDGNEVTGWSLNEDAYQVGEEVESYFNEKYNNAEMRKKRVDSTQPL